MPNAIPLSQVDCPVVSASKLIEDYDLLLLDAYGVLVNSSGALPGAAEFLREIRRQGKEFYIVTNDASSLPETCARRYQEYGLEIDPDMVVTSGSLLTEYFESEGLQGAETMVLGSPDSCSFVRNAGGIPIVPSADADFEVLALCDEGGYPLLPTMDSVLTNLCRHIDRGQLPKLVLPNPDILYPMDDNAYGFTSGGFALMIEAALAQRYPVLAPTFTRLGKPHSPMYREVRRRSSPDKKMVMVGDQIATDIVGARRVGIDAALVDTGIAKWDQLVVDPKFAPTYRVAGLLPSGILDANV